jgi:SPP1 gp7 family putative phage head morphogenesis protein
MITASEMEKSSVETVQWVTAEDERVCQQCEHLDGLVFPIDKVPNRPHIGCRCKIVKARKQK